MQGRGCGRVRVGRHQVIVPTIERIARGIKNVRAVGRKEPTFALRLAGGFVRKSCSSVGSWDTAERDGRFTKRNASTRHVAHCGIGADVAARNARVRTVETRVTDSDTRVINAASHGVAGLVVYRALRVRSTRVEAALLVCVLEATVLAGVDIKRSCFAVGNRQVTKLGASGADGSVRSRFGGAGLGGRGRVDGRVGSAVGSVDGIGRTREPKHGSCCGEKRSDEEI